MHKKTIILHYSTWETTNYLFLSFCFAVTFHIVVTYGTIILNGTSENESALVNVSQYLEGRKEEVKTI